MNNGPFQTAVMKLIPASSLRHTTVGLPVSAARPFLAQRCYATESSSSAEPRRRAVTPLNDDGRVPWHQLSAGEKTGRAAQQTFNFGMVIVGVTLTGTVGYFLYQEVFATDSKTAYFNRAVDRIRKDPRCLELLGDGKKISGFGEPTQNKWARARPISYVPIIIVTAHLC
jgi:mitochondrial import inner membrane translocase subunit TIM21